MGQKESKQSSSIWQVKDEPFEMKFEPLSLERSMKEDKQINSLGLPDDVLLLIVRHLSVQDLGRACQTCKTWRRLVLMDCVWEKHADEYSAFPEYNGREIVMRNYGEVMKESFTYFPLDYGSYYATDPLVWTKIYMASSSTPYAGKSKVVERFVCLHFVECDFNIEESYRKQMKIDKHDALLEIFDPCSVYGIDDARKAAFRECDVIVYCDKFDTENALEEMISCYQQARSTKYLGAQKRLPFVVVKTMADAKLKMKNRAKIMAWIEHVGSCFISCSARFGTNIDLIFKTAMRCIPRTPPVNTKTKQKFFK